MDRRELLGVLGAAGLVAVIDLNGHAQHEGHRGKVYEDCLKACEACGLAVRIIPNVQELVAGQVSLTAVREVAIEDLLRR